MTAGMKARSVELTVRERELLLLVAAGWSNAAIAEKLCCHVDTVKNRLRAVVRKLGARAGQAWLRQHRAQPVGAR